MDKQPKNALFQLWLHEARVVIRGKQDLLNSVMFFVLVVMLFPLGVDPGVEFLRISSTGLIWVAVLLSLMLTLGSMFKADFDDGTIELWLQSSHPIFALVFVKVLALWAISILPLLAMVPLLTTMLHFPFEALGVLILSLLLGSLALAHIVSVGAALTASAKTGGILLMLLVLPLTVPVLIFGSGVVGLSVDGASISGSFAMLGAITMLYCVLCPFAAGASLKIICDV
ncbi:hypothetical protein A3762_08445 [Oleiphilus sp. HI0125]|uniref:heme exporter protein CcmB n=1 Tax=Oleiphilus sp. HI0125 TaxID=1822266 RepID=UPI0007C40AF3|nr:heme exporter protein CcmB [Oleiphilus sp. HI0125]KZZ58137.1 hypothetical protein A3762_08445 [Oleiphilus sp. HI0125]